MAESLGMMSYWVEKKGITAALEEQYPSLLATDPILQAAYQQAIVADAALRGRVKQLEQGAFDDEDY